MSIAFINKNTFEIKDELNELLPIVGGTCPSKVTYLAFLNALEPIEVTVDGIVKNSNVLFVYILPKLTFSNAPLPIVVTVLGRINVLKLVLLLNVLSAILFIVFPSITVALDNPKYSIFGREELIYEKSSFSK